MTLRTNYNKVCLYCGVTFKSNRNTAQYCCSQHGSMYRTYGRSEELWEESGVIFENNRDVFKNNKPHAQVESQTFEHKTICEASQLQPLGVQYHAALLQAYKRHVRVEDDMWSIMLPSIYLKEHYQYEGPLPGERAYIISGHFLIKHFYDVLYKIKPVPLCSSEELGKVGRQWELLE